MWWCGGDNGFIFCLLHVLFVCLLACFVMLGIRSSTC